MFCDGLLFNESLTTSDSFYKAIPKILSDAKPETLGTNQLAAILLFMLIKITILYDYMLYQMHPLETNVVHVRVLKKKLLWQDLRIIQFCQVDVYCKFT